MPDRNQIQGLLISSETECLLDLQVVEGSYRHSTQSQSCCLQQQVLGRVTCLQVDVAGATFLSILLGCPGIYCGQDKHRRRLAHWFLLEGSLVECCAHIVLTHNHELVKLGLVVIHD